MAPAIDFKILEVTIAHVDEHRETVEELFPAKDFVWKIFGWEGRAGVVGIFDPFVLLEPKDVYGLDLVSFSVALVNKHLEKDGWHSYCTKKKLEQVLENLRCQNALLEAEIEKVKCTIGSNQHVPQACGKMEWKPDISVILPIDCIARIISFTSPLDACRLSLVCRAFCAAAGMDAVWERFLPSDFVDSIVNAKSCSSAKEKFKDYLRYEPVFLDDHYMTLSFAIDRRTGKKCLVVWNSIFKYRYCARRLHRLDLCCTDGIQSKFLSPKTAYVAYLVFKIPEKSIGFDRRLVEIYMHHEGGGGRGLRLVLLDPPEDMDDVPQERPDGWKEIVMAEFFNDYGEDGVGATIQWSVRRTDVFLFGFCIKAIEFRPKGCPSFLTSVVTLPDGRLPMMDETFPENPNREQISLSLQSAPVKVGILPTNSACSIHIPEF